ncbi:MAG: carbohydrate-binding family 9-like protein [Verrucomicrobia bacterium]|nr:carbohydrate-binding family 9-like protein [Verrucomicrobiota bacterium]
MKSIVSIARLASRSRSLPLTKVRAIILILGLAHLTLLAAADTSPDPKSLPAPKHVVVPKLHGPIKVDGELGEPAWAKAAVLEPFYLNDNGKQEHEHTAVRIWYDDDALYLGWTCRDTDIQATFTNRDDHLWEEEVVEFFVTPKSLTRYFEFEWNPLNTIFDAIINNDLDERGVSKGIRGEWDYTAKGLTNAVKVKGTVNNSSDRDQYWQVEVRLPFADLGHPAPQANEVWRANFYRYNRTKGRPEETVSWSPALLPGFHQPTRFGYLEFGK